jgi:hypothetical protein
LALRTKQVVFNSVPKICVGMSDPFPTITFSGGITLCLSSNITCLAKVLNRPPNNIQRNGITKFPRGKRRSMPTRANTPNNIRILFWF